MKKIFLLSIASLCLIFNSCKKDATTPGPSMKATVGGKAWTANMRVATLNAASIIITGTNLASLSTEAIALTINGTSTGTYELGLSANPSIATYTLGTTIYTSVSGSIIVTKIDTQAKKISGTFSFTGANTSMQTIIVTGGTFNELGYTSPLQ